MTTVTAPLARGWRPDLVDDLLPEGVRLTSYTPGRPSWALVFDGDLDDATVQAITDRMTSTDDTDQAERARIAAALDGGATNLPQMLAERELGRPVREPIYPE